MGTASSKFRKHLQNGEEYAAMQLYHGNPEFRRNLDPNISYGDSHHHNTPLHLVSQHAMKSMLRIFLFSLGGNPNKKNLKDQTSLHKLCSINAENGGGDGRVLFLANRKNVDTKRKGGLRRMGKSFDASLTYNSSLPKSSSFAGLNISLSSGRIFSVSRSSFSSGVAKSHSNVSFGAASSSSYSSPSPDLRLQLRRAECLTMMLQWRGGVMPDGERERVNISAVDEDGNSALHYAAASGLVKCVEILVAQGAPLFVENKMGQTPCDYAECRNHNAIAVFLESKMVFSQMDLSNDASEDAKLDTIVANDDASTESDPALLSEAYSGLRAQDLQEAKDQLLVETSDMLHVPLFTAEALLRNHEWSKETLLNAWIDDPEGCCEMSGVQLPNSFFSSFEADFPEQSRRAEEVNCRASKVSNRDLQVDTSNENSDSPLRLSPLGCRELWDEDYNDDNETDMASSTPKLSHQMTECRPSGSVKPSSLNADLEHRNRYLSHSLLGSTLCEICSEDIPVNESPVIVPCGHSYCRACWEQYLTVKIKEGDAHHIQCPGFDCSKLVPVDVIENLVKPDIARKYLQYDIQAFVESHPLIKWCPFPGCNRAVRVPKEMVTDLAAASMPNSPRTPSASQGDQAQYQNPNTTCPATPRYSYSVDCGNDHFFCWECLGEPHEPCACHDWVCWQKKVREIKPEELHNTDSETETAVNCLWLVTNSKPCPSCKSPIQKNEGCNHMKCSKCKHDFCWICLEPWKKHSSATGGYFRCNRFEVVEKIEEEGKEKQGKALERHKKIQELNKFVHYYTRYKNHENSYRMESPLLNKASQKMQELAQSFFSTSGHTAELESHKEKAVTSHDKTKFVQNAVKELLRARRVLRYSYVYGYYLDPQLIGQQAKIIFEFQQDDLESVTEQLSQMINRAYLRTPRTRVIHVTHLVRRKRMEFLQSISKGLLPPETPPEIRRMAPTQSPPNSTLTSHSPSNFDGAVSRTEPTSSVRNKRPVSLPHNIMFEDMVNLQQAIRESLNARGLPEEPLQNFFTNSRGLEAPQQIVNYIPDHVAMSNAACAKASGDQEFNFEFHMDLLRALEMSRIQLLHELDLTNSCRDQASGCSDRQKVRPPVPVRRTSRPDPQQELVLHPVHQAMQNQLSNVSDPQNSLIVIPERQHASRSSAQQHYYLQSSSSALAAKRLYQHQEDADIRRALEMSRHSELAIRNEGVQKKGKVPPPKPHRIQSLQKSVETPTYVPGESEEADLLMAIHLSLQDQQQVAHAQDESLVNANDKEMQHSLSSKSHEYLHQSDKQRRSRSNQEIILHRVKNIHPEIKPMIQQVGCPQRQLSQQQILEAQRRALQLVQHHHPPKFQNSQVPFQTAPKVPFEKEAKNFIKPHSLNPQQIPRSFSEKISKVKVNPSRSYYDTMNSYPHSHQSPTIPTLQYYPYQIYGYPSTIAYHQGPLHFATPTRAHGICPNKKSQGHNNRAQTNTVPRIPRINDSHPKSASYNSHLYRQNENVATGQLRGQHHGKDTPKPWKSHLRTSQEQHLHPGFPDQTVFSTGARSPVPLNSSRAPSPPNTLQLVPQPNPDGSLVLHQPWTANKQATHSLPRRYSVSSYGPWQLESCPTSSRPNDSYRSQTLPRSTSSAERPFGPHKLLKACRSPSMDSESGEWVLIPQSTTPPLNNIHEPSTLRKEESSKGTNTGPNSQNRTIFDGNSPNDLDPDRRILSIPSPTSLGPSSSAHSQFKSFSGSCESNVKTPTPSSATTRHKIPSSFCERKRSPRSSTTEITIKNQTLALDFGPSELGHKSPASSPRFHRHRRRSSFGDKASCERLVPRSEEPMSNRHGFVVKPYAYSAQGHSMYPSIPSHQNRFTMDVDCPIRPCHAPSSRPHHPPPTTYSYPSEFGHVCSAALPNHFHSNFGASPATRPAHAHLPYSSRHSRHPDESATADHVIPGAAAAAVAASSPEVPRPFELDDQLLISKVYRTIRSDEGFPAEATSTSNAEGEEKSWLMAAFPRNLVDAGELFERGEKSQDAAPMRNVDEGIDPSQAEALDGVFQGQKRGESPLISDDDDENGNRLDTQLTAINDSFGSQVYV